MKRSILVKFILLLILLVSILSPLADAATVTAGGRRVGTLVQNRFTIHQNKLPYATDLHYKVWQKEDYIEINGWRIKTSHFTRSPSQRGDQPEPYHSDGDNRRHAIDVTAWGEYVPYCTNVTIDVEFWLTGWNTIRLSNVRWTRENQARWTYHPRYHGKLTVYGTINCNRIGYPLFIGPVRRCKTYRGAVPYWANDYEIVFKADPPGCSNRNKHYKVIARRFKNGRWYFEELADWLVNNHDISVALPVIADMRGDPNDPNNPIINPDISCVVDIEQWLAAGPPPEPNEPNDPNITYNIVNGYSPNLPGFFVGVGDITFNPEVNDANATLGQLFDFNEVNDFEAVVTRVGDLTLDANEGMIKAIPDIGWTIGTPQDNNDDTFTHLLTVANDDPCDRIWLQDIRYFVSDVDYNDLSQLDFNDANYVDVNLPLDPNDSYDVDILTVGARLDDHIYHKFTIAPDSNGYPGTTGRLTSIADHIIVPDCSPSLASDINGDCRVNFYDVAILAADWLECTLPEGQCP